MEYPANNTSSSLGHRLVVLGGGESGVGAAILGKEKGMEVFLSDMGTIAPRYRRMLDEEGIEWEEGTHTMARILAADEVVKSPGIPPTAELVCLMAYRLLMIPVQER